MPTHNLYISPCLLCRRKNTLSARYKLLLLLGFVIIAGFDVMRKSRSELVTPRGTGHALEDVCGVIF
jgi:hypothetical protein